MVAGTLDKQLKQQLTQATEHVKEGNFDSAIINLKAILNQYPKHEISLGMLASVYLQIGMQKQAIDLYETLLQANPKNPLARLQLGMAKFNSGHPQQALSVWEPMLTMDKEFMANFHSAQALVQLGRDQEALNLLVNPRQHMPPSHPLYPQLLDLYAQLTERTA